MKLKQKNLKYIKYYTRSLNPRFIKIIIIIISPKLLAAKNIITKYYNKSHEGGKS